MMLRSYANRYPYPYGEEEKACVQDPEPIGRWGEYIVSATIMNVSVKKAIQEYGSVAIDAITMELKSMIDKEIWEPIPVWERTRNVIPSKMFLTEKFDADGKFV